MRTTASNGLVPKVVHEEARPPVSAHRVLVYLTAHAPANLEIQSAARLADRLGGTLVAACVVPERRASKGEHDGRASDDRVLATNISLAEAVGATVVKVPAENVPDALVALADREGFTHAVFGHSGGLGDLFAPDSIITGFVSRSRGVEIEIVKRPGTA